MKLSKPFQLEILAGSVNRILFFVCGYCSYHSSSHFSSSESLLKDIGSQPLGITEISFSVTLYVSIIYFFTVSEIAII